ncbi:MULTISPECIES: 2-succinyl-5-enolpyruvyl-6-hydroxy-3-cyclohexene-1-carboxylic-acid synthase [Staphylococcus]|jgi:2-succinyl-5-enolpyruvyl-6-hydroxy-3-cyclohexene-1-carboxylate synthase|uniref:2-succinyl-5-enolpyruvyl-6-hydroxy-3- cyclohexene-1-carboxylic-acid synthase n=1 Tax=Staphylococcus TaxID=1279 RepID=UPI0006615756|nr:MULTISPECIES: 2-succinyl-5-enolpyruvyl-6-hydroxy-3-cyclohexene-1-carboxylic-acid synthase [Staphylococcus]OFM61776.1 2-succinyl-5-enolpyruvyl-6-hydroxy-3-cyclohexene-1-carboxylate synthase [Staphylococcus sp. HMSC059G05]OFM65314.1 2-succinyl-5-enolpyruvyl-6-hydroxy-3-cyclohexene-1-carboxylate synthase [Staphylococcus sp. HMSC062C01]MBC3059916.1 2-succinyl-5-enolpyruvyl-6-hydroxy-3-cyclohexene-1-carboxylic-acid synthase [Staphylococcus hominis]MBC3066105.1 2-succinyl-5-enolpyruvyl-6-hydroxy-3
MNHKEALTKQVYTFASELYAYGVREVVISPGSRSTPLAIAFEAHPNIKTWIHPDERSAAFFALGLIKGSERPVAILCTSGTAAANYTPAIAESQISRIPLIVLTSDRPHELRSVGAPQAINQVNMFANYINFQFDMPVADGSQEMLNTINYQMQIASQYLYGPHRGPIHFNLPFREPLTPDLEMTENLKSEHKILPHYQKNIDIQDIKNVLKDKKGLIIVGDMQHQAVDQILTYATIHDLPILADPLSQLRKFNHPNVITTYDLLYRSHLNIDADFIIRVGKPVISKKLNQWLTRTNAFQILVQNNDKIDVFPTPPHISYEISANDFFRSLVNEPTVNRKDWIERWQSIEAQSRKAITQHMSQATDESAFVSTLIQKLTKDDALFVSNSMPIRDVDNLLFDSEVEVYANRGANGIDGVISTALGMAVHKRVTLLIGDLAFYHDMNGLLMAKLNDIHINIVILNNDGGGIFSYLPQKTAAEQYFERLFGTPTGLNFEYTAMLYDFSFKRLNNITDFSQVSFSNMNSYIYEMITNREDNLEQHQLLYKKLSEILNVTL